MKNVFEQVMACDDLATVKNCFYLLADSCEEKIYGRTLLEAMKQVSGEINGSHYDEEMAVMHLRAISQEHTMDIAKDYWCEANTDFINLWDWCVLWGEMNNRHGEKIKEWFNHPQDIEYERKIFDECQAFLKQKERPFDVFIV